VTMEGHALPVSLSLVAAVDSVKLHFILNMEYASECRHILHFLQRCMFHISDDLPLSPITADLFVYTRSNKQKCGSRNSKLCTYAYCATH